MTLEVPLSAGYITINGLLLNCFKAANSAFRRFWVCLGTFRFVESVFMFWIVSRISEGIDLSGGSHLDLSINFSGWWLNFDFLKWYAILSLRPKLEAASIMGILVTFFGVGMKFKPLSRTLCSMSESGYFDRFMTDFPNCGTWGSLPWSGSSLNGRKSVPNGQGRNFLSSEYCHCRLQTCWPEYKGCI